MRSRIYDVLKTLNEEYGTTIIVIEHHTEFIATYCKQVVLMDQGKVCWKKDVREALCSVEDLVITANFSSTSDFGSTLFKS